jgi:hypothetical protein
LQSYDERQRFNELAGAASAGHASGVGQPPSPAPMATPSCLARLLG